MTGTVPPAPAAHRNPRSTTSSSTAPTVPGPRHSIGWSDQAATASLRAIRGRRAAADAGLMTPHRLTTLTAAGLVLALAFAIAAPAFADHHQQVARQTPPQATVRDFLSSAVVNGNGFTASRYLTPRARNSFEHRGTGP